MQKCIMAAVICSLCTNGNVYANKLEISSKNNTWKYLKESCKAANAAVSCSAIDCNTDFVLLYDVSNLPSTFIAWINTYLVKSASIVYQGCFSVPSTFFETQIQRYTNRNPLNCVRDCFSSSTTGLRYYSHIGINTVNGYTPSGKRELGVTVCLTHCLHIMEPLTFLLSVMKGTV